MANVSSDTFNTDAIVMHEHRRLNDKYWMELVRQTRTPGNAAEREARGVKCQWSVAEVASRGTRQGQRHEFVKRW
jgi:hypothetical protein